MNAENFAEYLKNPSKLYQINYQELKSLALQYPYCQNLQWLLLQKSKMDGNKDWEANLERAAAISIDRALLYKKIKTIVSVRDQVTDLLITDEVLELPDLSNFRRPEPILREVSTAHPLEEPVPFPNPIENFKQPEIEEEELDMSRLQVPPRPTELPEIDPEPGITQPTPTPEVPEPTDPTPTIPDINPEVPETNDPEPMLSEDTQEEAISETSTNNSFEWEVYTPPILEPAPPVMPSHDARNQNLLSYAKTYQPPKLQIKSTLAGTSLPKKEASVADLAEKSVLDTEEVASETLAVLLARQGHTEKAIKMYEQLILKFPGKSAYFAAQIQKLKQA